MAELERLYTIQEVARAYHVSEDTIRRWIKNGDIKYTPVGPFRLKRIDLKDVTNGQKRSDTEHVGSGEKAGTNGSSGGS